MKGHSERVPNKNMRSFAGRPLYHRIMDALLSASSVARVVVNTDSEAIKQDIETCFGDGVVIHWRPETLRGDFVAMNRIIEHDLSLLPDDQFLQTHSTNPLVTAATIDSCVSAYAEALGKGYDSLFSVTALHTRLYDRTGVAMNHDPELLVRTQDLAPVFEENSCVYLFNRESFRTKQRRIGGNPLQFEIPRSEAWDIDEEMDFRVAEFLWKENAGALQNRSAS
jgi:CMP-N-acetylneuraminic acid synthetase